MSLRVISHTTAALRGNCVKLTENRPIVLATKIYPRNLAICGLWERRALSLRLQSFLYLVIQKDGHADVTVHCHTRLIPEWWHLHKEPFPTTNKEQCNALRNTFNSSVAVFLVHTSDGHRDVIAMKSLADVHNYIPHETHILDILYLKIDVMAEFFNLSPMIFSVLT